MIRAINVSYEYPNGVRAINNVTIEIDRGVTVLMGPNGAGKTTLLKILAGILKPIAGRLIINNMDYWSAPKDKRILIRRKIVYLHEKPILLRGSVLENIMYPLLIRGIDKDTAKEKALEFLESMRLKEIAHRRRKELSAGEAQLVAFLRALITNPQYLLLDEPTSFLDIKKRKIVEQFLKELASQGKYVVIATHDRLLAFSLATKVIMMNNGTIERELNKRELISEFSDFIH